MILGVDVSTSITGLAIVADGSIVYYDSVDLRKYKNVFEKGSVLKEKIVDLYEAYQFSNEEFLLGNSKYPIEHIYIEQPFTFFNSGGSSAKTMATLQKFNGIVSWFLYEIFEMQPNYVLAQSARKTVGIKVPRGEKAKAVVLKYLLDTEPAFNVEYTKQGNPKPESYDRADAIIVAKAGYIIEQERENADPE